MKNGMKKLSKSELLSMLIEEKKKNEELGSEIESKNDIIRSLEYSNNEFSKKSDQLTDNVKILSRTKTDLENKLRTASRKSEENDGKYRKVLNSKNAVSESLAEKEKYIENLKIDMSQLREEISDSEMTNVELTEINRVLKDRIKRLESEQEKTSDEIAALKKGTEEHKKENSKLSDDINELKRAADETNKRLADKERKVTELKKEIAALNEQASFYADENQTLESEIDEKNAELMEFRNKSIVSEGKMEELRNNISNLEKKFEKKKAENYELQNRIEDLQKDSNDKEEAIREITERYEELKKELFEVRETENGNGEYTEEKSSVSVYGADEFEAEDLLDKETVAMLNEDEDMSMKLDNIFKLAKLKANQYVEVMKVRSENQAKYCNKLKEDTITRCRIMEREKQKICESMIDKVKAETDAILEDVKKRAVNISRSQDVLYQELLEKLINIDF